MVIKIIIGAIALLHFYIMYMEMFAWTTLGRKSFGRRNEGFYEDTEVMAGNQGLYNGFLAAGLVWSLLIEDVVWSQNVASFFLICVALAGLYGAWSAHKKILYIQAFPAILALILLWSL